jgi:hypothetical protein
MSRSNMRTVAFAATTVLLVSACTGSSELAGDATGGRDAPEIDELGELGEPAVVPMPAVTEMSAVTTTASSAIEAAAPVALIDRDGQLGILTDGAVSNKWVKFTAFPSPDRSTAVMTLGPHIDGIGPERPVMWASLSDGEPLAEQTMRTSSELTATSLDGTFAGFTTRSAEAAPGTIAGARTTSDIEIISRDDGSVFRQQLDGNFVPEAFSRSTSADGVPTLVFLLEYFPAQAPRFYRVRVLSTETGDVSLPLNLRNKLEQVDERMAGLSRSQVVAEDHGLLFTLYRGTIDGTPDGEPYAFVHTLDFADGVWCLEVDPQLELDRVPGSLAVGGDRLYVASANGFVGAYPIPSLSDPNLSPSMDWVATFSGAGERAPAMAADDDGVWIGPDDPVSRLVRITADGDRGDPLGLPSSGATALVIDEGSVHAIGDEWATFDITKRPDWLDEIVHLVVN